MVPTFDATRYRIYGASTYAGRMVLAGIAFTIACIQYAVLRESCLIQFAILVGVLAGYSAIRLSWWIEARPGQITIGGLFCRSQALLLDAARPAYSMSERSAIDLTIPPSSRQYIVVPQDSRPNITVKQVWRRAPWGDESAFHPQLVKLISIANIPTKGEANAPRDEE